MGLIIPAGGYTEPEIGTTEAIQADTTAISGYTQIVYK